MIKVYVKLDRSKEMKQRTTYNFCTEEANYEKNVYLSVEEANFEKNFFSSVLTKLRSFSVSFNKVLLVLHKGPQRRHGGDLAWALRFKLWARHITRSSAN